MDQISWLTVKFIYFIITMHSFFHTWYLWNSCSHTAVVLKCLLQPFKIFQKFIAAFQLFLWAFLISSEKKATVSLATLPDKSWQWAMGICSKVECNLLPNIKYLIFLFFGTVILGADSLYTQRWKERIIC